MKKGWTTTKLIAVGSLAVLHMILSLTGAGLQAVVGLPIVAGVVNGFFAEAIVIICLLSINKFGAAAFLRTIYSILVLPLATLGTPGFLPKVVIGASSGLIVDILYIFLKKWDGVGSAIIIGGISEVYLDLTIVGLGKLFTMPGIEQAANLFLKPEMLVGAFIMGSIGGYLGYLIYQKIKDTAVVKRIQL